MPGLLTPERRARAKNRSKASIDKKGLDAKIKKSKPEKKSRPKRSSYQPVGSNDSDSSSYNSASMNSILAPRTASPASSEDSSPRKSNRRYHDDATADITNSSMSSLGSPASFRVRGASYGSTPNKYPIREEAYLSDEDMPDDEMMSTRKSPTKSSSKPMVTPTKDAGTVLGQGLSDIMAMVTPSKWSGSDERETIEPRKFVSPDSTNTGIQSMISALHSGSGRPSNLSHAESLLWDSLQTAIAKDRDERRQSLEEDLHKSGMEQKFTAMSIVVENHKDDNDLGDKRGVLTVQLEQIEALRQELQEKDKIMKEQEESHTSEVLAIQRVLADVTTEKMKLEGVDVSDIKPDVDSKQFQSMKKELAAANLEIESVKREADQKTVQIKELESDLEKSSEEKKALAAENEETKDEMEILKVQLENMKSANDAAKSGAAMEKLEDEVNHQKLETEKLKVEKMETQVALASAQEEARKLKADNDFVRQELKKLQAERNVASNEAEVLRKEAARAEETVKMLTKEKEAASNQLEELRKSKAHAMSEVDKAINQAKAIKAEHPMISPSSSTEEEVKEQKEEAAKPEVSVEEFAKLQQSLTETTASLETSKKIIASLESANGSLAVDSRSKLKEKEEELGLVQKELENRKRNLDSLATELRDLQRKQGDIENADRRTKVQLIRQKALMDHLESTLNDLQDAVIVHESSTSMMEGIADNSNLEEISEILGDALHAITATLETSEEFVEDVDADSEYGSEMNSDVGRQIDAIIHNSSSQMKNELDAKKIAVKRLEEALKKQNEEIKRIRSQFYNTDNSQLRTEISRLRQQCSTNMEVLAKKERELSVLKASLKVDENESGYISDDASDEEDEDAGTEVGSIMSATKIGYGPADAEAYATILSQANGRIGMPAAAQIQEIESLKRDLMEALGEKESASKELQARRESLANAKMIISSLEQANKGMMADLRSRLQDSNTAISSLLNKSKQHENAADELRQKMQALEQERQEERTKYEAELRQLRTEAVDLEEKKEDSS